MRSRVAALVVIGACAALPYLQILAAPFQYDDWYHIVENPAMRLARLTPGDLWSAAVHNTNATRPWTNLTLSLNNYVGGLDVRGYHLVNLGLHLAVAWSVYGLIVTTLMLPRLAPRYGPAAHRIAMLAAVLWAVHPVQIQAVTYIVQRFTSQAALGSLLTLLGYVKGRIARGWRRLGWGGVAILAAVLALGSKETAAVLPVALAAYEIYFLSHPHEWTARQRVGGAMALLAVEILLASVYLWAGDLGRRVDPLYQTWSTPWEHAMTEARVLISYLTLLLFPHPSRLTILHSVPISHSLVDPPTTALAVLAIAAWLGLIVWTARRAPLLSFGLLWILLHLALEAVLPLQPMFEYRLYLPSVGAAVIASVGWNRAWDAASGARWASLVAAAWLVITIATLIVWTRDVNRLWLDEVSLWTDAREKAPTDARPFVYLGKAYWLRGMRDEAREAVEAAISRQPAAAAAYLIQGHLDLETGHLEHAITSYRAAARSRPDYAEAWYHLGITYSAQGRLDAASRAYRTALVVRPQFLQARYNLALLEWRQRDRTAALATLRVVLTEAPDFAEAHNGLGTIYGEQDRLKEATAAFRQAVALKPGYAEAHHNLARAYALQGLQSLAAQEEAIARGLVTPR